MTAVAAAMVATASSSDVLALAAHTRHIARVSSSVPDPVLLGPEDAPGFDGWVVGALPAWFSPLSMTPAPPAAPALPKSSIPPPTAPIVAALGASGIPQVALRAYVHAARSVAVTHPSCHLDWSVLAAIGRVESNHGRFGGAQLRADGSTTKPIRGIPLDGRPGVARILDSDNGVFDGDPTFDRAVGPMQFLPSTWHFVAADGNGDGAKDPNNIFDATLGAARYLCAGGTDLSDRAALTTAILRYNHSDDYAALVLALADAYHSGHSTLPAAEPVSPAPPVTAPVLPPATVGDPPGIGDIGSTDNPATPTTPPATTPPATTPPPTTTPPSCPPASPPPPATSTDTPPAGSTDTSASPSTDSSTDTSSDPSAGTSPDTSTSPASCSTTDPPPPPPTSTPPPPPPTTDPPPPTTDPTTPTDPGTNPTTDPTTSTDPSASSSTSASATAT